MSHIRLALMILGATALIGLGAGVVQLLRCAPAQCAYLPLTINSDGPPSPTELPMEMSQPRGWPTAQPGRVSIFGNHSAWTSSSGTFHVVGEVRNVTSQMIESVQISVQFFNANRQVVGTVSTAPILDTIHAGGRACFKISLPAPPKDWSSYTFAPVAYIESSHNDPEPNLTLLDLQNGVQPNGRYTLSGSVRNDGSQRVSAVQVVGILYDSYGVAQIIVDCETTVVAALDPGQTQPFAISFAGRRMYSGEMGWGIQAYEVRE